MFQIHNGDCAEVMASMGDNSVDAIVTDPPYGLSFMGAEWDTFGDGRKGGGRSNATFDQVGGNHHPTCSADQARTRKSENAKFQAAMTPIFEEALRVAKPGAHLLCFGGTRTFHRMACAIEDAGWEIRDSILWVWSYGQGFPKSMDVGKAIDKALGKEREKVPNPKAKQQTAQRGTVAHGDRSANDYITPVPVSDAAAQWDGWGTCLKPAWEPIIVARKPLDGTVVHNVMTYGTGAINIDGCRVPINGERLSYGTFHSGGENGLNGTSTFRIRERHYPEGYQPEGRFPANLVHDGSQEVLELFPNDSGRFFYCAKASKKERGEGNVHPTVKPIALMKWLVTLVTPEGGVVLDPFAGSGTTLVAAKMLGRDCIGIEREPEYVEIIKRRLGEEDGRD